MPFDSAMYGAESGMMELIQSVIPVPLNAPPKSRV